MQTATNTRKYAEIDMADAAEYLNAWLCQNGGSFGLRETPKRTIQELSIETFALQCAVNAETACESQIAERSTLMSEIALRVGKG
ncbi:TPA: hypothetical protein ACIJWR_000500 [Citrobacter sedlakii]|nr:hypothetical protein [Citrobacter sedlakii]